MAGAARKESKVPTTQARFAAVVGEGVHNNNPQVAASICYDIHQAELAELLEDISGFIKEENLSQFTRIKKQYENR